MLTPDELDHLRDDAERASRFMRTSLDIHLGDLLALLDAAGERDRLAAAIERVRELHVPYTTGVLTGDCAAEACDHEDDCPTQELEYCAGCDELAEAADCYYMERDARLTAYPCPTIRALSGSDGHTTRDIKQRGECPAYDDHHAQREQR